MILALLLALTHQGRQTLRDDDGHAVTPKAFSSEYVHADLKQLKAFDLTSPCRVVGLAIKFAGSGGDVTLHLWRDIDSTVHPYVPFRRFEWDVVPPVHIRAA